jgi:hypothetical protein
VPVGLPQATVPLTTQPPLVTNVVAFPVRYTGRIASAEVVRVRVTPAGRVVAVDVRQRLTIAGKGDYRLSVQAPLLDATAGAGSESEPGVRDGVLLWQGFSPSRRVLVADVSLRPALTAAALPLRVRLEGSGTRRLRLVLENRTITRVVSVSAVGVPRQVAAALDAARRRVAAGAPPTPVTVDALAGSVRRRDRDVGAPLQVVASVRLPPGARVVGADASAGLSVESRAQEIVARGLLPATGRSATLELRLSGPVRAPAARVVATPLPGSPLLRPPGAATWRDLLRAGGPAVQGRPLFDRAVQALLEVARARQYGQFVANPDGSGRLRATYVYRVAPVAAPRPAPAPPDGADDQLLAGILVAMGILGLGAIGVIAWAHA